MKQRLNRYKPSKKENNKKEEIAEVLQELLEIRSPNTSNAKFDHQQKDTTSTLNNSSHQDTTSSEFTTNTKILSPNNFQGKISWP